MLLQTSELCQSKVNKNITQHWQSIQSSSNRLLLECKYAILCDVCCVEEWMSSSVFGDKLLSVTLCCRVSFIQRVMASGFFVLMRFFMRVDGLLVRMNDTRFYHQVVMWYTSDSHVIAEWRESTYIYLQVILLFESCMIKFSWRNSPTKTSQANTHKQQLVMKLTTCWAVQLLVVLSNLCRLDRDTYLENIRAKRLKHRN